MKFELYCKIMKEFIKRLYITVYYNLKIGIPVCFHTATFRAQKKSGHNPLFLIYLLKLFAEIPFQHALEPCAVTRFVLRHFVHGVVDQIGRASCRERV